MRGGVLKTRGWGSWVRGSGDFFVLGQFSFVFLVGVLTFKGIGKDGGG